MREILFRGQTRRKGEKVKMDGTPVESNWVYGGVLQGTGEHSIIYGCNDPDDKGAANLDKWPVYTDTIGQYTGLKDKNGKRIFEGDIVEAILTRADGCSELTLTRTEKGIIWYDLTGMLGLQVDRTGSGEPVWSDFFYELDLSGLILDYSFEVLGNIHDNPELMDGGEE